MTALENMWIELYMVAMISIIFLLDNKKSEKNSSLWYYNITLLLQIAVLLTDVVLWFFEYKKSGIFLVYQIMWTVNYMLFVTMVLFYSLYLFEYIKENYEIESKYPMRYFIFIFIVSFCLWISSYWTEKIFILNKDFYPIYCSLYSFIFVFALLLIVPDVFILFKVKKKMEKKMWILFLFYLVCPIISLALEDLLDIDCVFYSSTCLSLILVYVGVSQKNRLITYNQGIEIQRRESELREIEQKVMMGNIQPLFIQSVLASIADMAPKDPKKAEETTSSFATYLRMNLNSVGKNEPVPFEEELRHADAFLDLETKIRPGKIKVEHEINAVNFFLPVLTLLPIVENAIVHGILPKSGGTIKLWSREEDDSFLIGVDDDGIGFDSSLVPDGVGIKNTRERIIKFCGGSLSISSGKNLGTKVIIIIPKNTNMTF
ncbi:MAG: sensor histidine kinase [Candidatus Ornithospirochaeta sp.]